MENPSIVHEVQPSCNIDNCLFYDALRQEAVCTHKLRIRHKFCLFCLPIEQLLLAAVFHDKHKFVCFAVVINYLVEFGNIFVTPLFMEFEVGLDFRLVDLH